MVRRKTAPNRSDAMLDDRLADCQGPEDILGEAGLLKQISARLVDRALTGELNHHLAHDELTPEANSGCRNSCNGASKNAVQSTQGDLDLSIPRDRNGDVEPILVPKHQRRLSGLDDKAMDKTYQKTRPIKNWRAALSHFAILFPERFKL
jgi:putative transposase